MTEKSGTIRPKYTLVEGKTDETFLTKALNILKITNPNYSSLKFEYLSCGGAEGVKLMTKKFTPKMGQRIIALFVCDQAGWNSINKIFDRSQSNRFNSNNFRKYRKEVDIWIATFPIRPYYKGGVNFNIEDYFSKSFTKQVCFEFF